MNVMKRDFSKSIVAAVVALTVLFTAAVLYVFLRTGNEPTTLVVAWFSFITSEMWFLAGIRKKKLEKGDRDNANLY